MEGYREDGDLVLYAVSVFEKNTNDSTTLIAQAEKARHDFGIQAMVLVGDSGMISQKQIDELRKVDGMAWITALKTGAIRKLMKTETLQLDLFDERNLFELTDEDFPLERLVACRNEALGRKRKHTRDSLIEATKKELPDKIQTKKLEDGTTVHSFKTPHNHMNTITRTPAPTFHKLHVGFVTVLRQSAVVRFCPLRGRRRDLGRRGR